MRRLAAACLLAAVPAAFAADPPLKAGFGFQPPAKEAEKKPAQKKEGDPKPAEKQSIPAVQIKPAGGDAPAVVQKTSARGEQVKAAIQSYASQCASYVDFLNRQESEKDKIEALKFAPTPAFAAGNVARLVLADPTDDAAFDGLTWLVKYAATPAVTRVLNAVPASTRGGKPSKLDVAAVLLEHHANNPKLAGVIRTVQPLNDATAALLSGLAEKSKDGQIKTQAGLHLADLYNRSTEKPDFPAADREKNLAAAEKLLEKLIADKDLADVKYGRGTAAEQFQDTLREIRTLTVGKKLPALKGESVDGSAVSSEDYKGKVLVLDIWATWCGPCVAMIPHEREMVKKLKDKPFAFVSISCDAKKETLTNFLEKEPMPWVHWFDGQGGKVNKALNIRFFPTVYVIDTKGVIRYKNVRNEVLEHAVEKLLAEAAGEKSSSGQ